MARRTPSLPERVTKFVRENHPGVDSDEVISALTEGANVSGPALQVAEVFRKFNARGEEGQA